MESGRIRAALAAAAVVAGAVVAGITIPDDGPEPLPEESAEIVRVLDAIESGAPLPYEEDGGVFQNRERLLPEQPLGYYREYTVETPGSPDRGARRLVIGKGGETYYTDDHYASFTEIDPEAFR